MPRLPFRLLGLSLAVVSPSYLDAQSQAEFTKGPSAKGFTGILVPTGNTFCAAFTDDRKIVALATKTFTPDEVRSLQLVTAWRKFVAAQHPEWRAVCGHLAPGYTTFTGPTHLEFRFVDFLPTAPTATQSSNAVQAEIEQVEKDIAIGCPGSSRSSREECADMQEQLSDLQAESAGASRDDLREASRERARANGMAQAQQYLQQQEALRAAMTPQRPLPRDAPSYSAPGYQPSGNDPNFPSASQRGSPLATFGPLPSDMGTPAQRQFWASRCQNIANDGGSAAQGCNQTLQSMGISPASQPSLVSSGQNTGGMAYAPNLSNDTAQSGQGATGNSYVANKHEAHAEQCVSVAPGSRTHLLNRCGFRVNIAYCVSNQNNAFTCTANGGGGNDNADPGEEMWTSVGENDGTGIRYEFHYSVCRDAIALIKNYGKTAVCF